MKVRALRMLGLLGLIWIFTACSSAEQFNLTAEVRAAEAKWQEQGVESYRIEVETGSIWHDQYHQITVTEGTVVEESASCNPAPVEYRECEVEAFNAEDYTVSGLFSRVRSLAQTQNVQWAKIEFDPTYGFPSFISFDHPEAIDEEWVWRVRSFEPLE